MKDQYLALSDLKKHTGYSYLEELWMLQMAKIDESQDKVAAGKIDQNWKYWVGVEKGFKLATTQLARALQDLEKEDENLDSSDKITQMLTELRSKGESK